MAARIVGLLLAMAPLSSAIAIEPVLAQIREQVVRLPVDEAQGLRFHRISTADGLSQTRVAQIIQDDQGFLWFGTQYGINRYDGYDFKLFVHEPGNEKSAAGTFVFALFKDRDGFIWVGWNEGLDRLDPRTETFTHYKVDPEEGARRANTVVHISQDRQGLLWLATGAGLHRLDPASGQFTHYVQGDEADSLPTNNINWTGEDSAGRFWVGTSEGLSEFDRKQGRVLRHIGLPDSVQIRLFEDRAGRHWIMQASGNGLSLFDPKSNLVTPYSFYKTDPGANALTGVMGIEEDAEGNIWLGSPGIGLLRLNRERDRFFHYGYQPQDVHSIAENKVIALLKDRDGTIWTGLHSTGVNYFGKGSQRFEVFRHIPGDPDSLTLDFVNAIFEDRDGILWIGNDDGLNRIDRTTGKRELIPLGLGVKPMIIALSQDNEGAMWVGTFAHGLTRYDPRSGHHETFVHDTRNPRSLSNNQVHRIYIDRRGRIWAATDDGLSRYDPSTRDFTVFKMRSDSRLSQAFVAIEEDDEGKFWIGSVYSGVHHFDPETGTITTYRHMRGDPDGLRDDTVPAVHRGRNGILWLGTQNGLNSLDPRTGKLRAYDTRNGMPANTVSCILEDDNGDIWFSTTKGIAKFSPAVGNFSNYTFDGLPGNDFTGWDACRKGRTGELFFAGFSGAVAFHPAALEEERATIPLVLTDFLINGDPVRIGRDQPLKRAINYSERVTLDHTQRNFSVTFAGLRYASPETTRYRYRLEGLADGAWQEIPGSIRQATYTTLPAGNYRLHVQLAPGKGDWQQPGASLAIAILPPWWATWWSIALALLLLLALVTFAVRMRVRTVARRITLEMEARGNERLRIAGDLHDTLLQGLLSASYQLSIVQEEVPQEARARPLLEHVGNLLRQLVEESRNTVRGLRTWNVDAEDLEQAIAAVPADLQVVAGAKVSVTVDGKSRPLEPSARIEVYLIAREAVSNALRHAEAGAIEVMLEYLADSFRLTIRDDGKGFASETVTAGRGNHFGLSVMNERAGRLQGTLALSSAPGSGTEVILSVPARAIYRRGRAQTPWSKAHD